MKIDNAVTLLRSLKGAPLSVLIAIRLCPGPASLLQLAAATGYERTAVTQAVTGLEMMGFVERAHYRGWQLTRAAVQLPLWTPCEIGTIAPDACPALGAGVEVDRPPPVEDIRELKAVKNHFQQNGTEAGDAPEILKAGKNHFQPGDDGSRGGSGGSGLINLTTEVKEPPPLLQPQEELKAGKNHFQPAEQENAPPPFDDAEQDLLNDLIDLTGCPRRRAEKAVRTALDEGYYTPWLHLQVLYWHAYLHDDRGSNLKNPGYFVAKKLENGEACPFDKARTCHREKAEDLLYAWRRLRDETTN